VISRYVHLLFDASKFINICAQTRPHYAKGVHLTVYETGQENVLQKLRALMKGEWVKGLLPQSSVHEVQSEKSFKFHITAVLSDDGSLLFLELQLHTVYRAIDQGSIHSATSASTGKWISITTS
jgi:hypothetical protein